MKKLSWREWSLIALGILLVILIAFKWDRLKPEFHKVIEKYHLVED